MVSRHRRQSHTIENDRGVTLGELLDVIGRNMHYQDAGFAGLQFVVGLAVSMEERTRVEEA